MKTLRHLVVVLGCLCVGCSPSMPTAETTGTVHATRSILQQGQDPGSDRPGLNRPNPEGSKRPVWWGRGNWSGSEESRPAWWGQVPASTSSLLVLNGYYYPYYTASGYYYPDWTQPYTYVRGAFLPANDAPSPSLETQEALIPDLARVVTVRGNEHMER